MKSLSEVAEARRSYAQGYRPECVGRRRTSQPSHSSSRGIKTLTPLRASSCPSHIHPTSLHIHST
ncbi:hypothetical protein E2C01_031284 [Portunus trituberculatus]|uniref:Uncharacterized protein n=1 Tax=Portunus trituberculatus TaxID=210409 RepID=A0A5B7EY64_PORTR|nr:hypothetical protein [Portunus trituberculatus]